MASSPDTVVSSTPTTTASKSTTGQSRPSAVTSSNVFVIKALDKIESAKETRRNKALKEAVLNAQSKLYMSVCAFEGTHSCSLPLYIDSLKNNEPHHEGATRYGMVKEGEKEIKALMYVILNDRSTLILAALQMAIDTRSANLMTIALDCLGKFITYNYLGDMENEVAQTQVMEKVVDSICDCFIGEETDEKVQLQLVKVRYSSASSFRFYLTLSSLLDLF